MSKQQELLFQKINIKKVFSDYINEYLSTARIHIVHDGYTMCGHYGRGSIATIYPKVANCGLCKRCAALRGKA